MSVKPCLRNVGILEQIDLQLCFHLKWCWVFNTVLWGELVLLVLPISHCCGSVRTQYGSTCPTATAGGDVGPPGAHCSLSSVPSCQNSHSQLERGCHCPFQLHPSSEFLQEPTSGSPCPDYCQAVPLCATPFGRPTTEAGQESWEVSEMEVEKDLFQCWVVALPHIVQERGKKLNS